MQTKQACKMTAKEQRGRLHLSCQSNFTAPVRSLVFKRRRRGGHTLPSADGWSLFQGYLSVDVQDGYKKGGVFYSVHAVQ